MLLTQKASNQERRTTLGYSKGTLWTDELIKEKVNEVKHALSIDRMPSRRECELHFHNTCLANAISRRPGGWRQLAIDMGLPVKESETYFGKQQESIAEEILISEGFSVRRMSQNFPYDLLVDDCVKIDVKASHLYHGQNGDFFTFNLEKPFATCDIYLLFTLTDENEIISAYVVPSKFVIANNQISMGVMKSKYHRFENRLDYISKMSEFWDSVS